MFLYFFSSKKIHSSEKIFCIDVAFKETYLIMTYFCSIQTPMFCVIVDIYCEYESKSNLQNHIFAI